MKTPFLKTIIAILLLVVLLLTFFWHELTTKASGAAGSIFSDGPIYTLLTPEQEGRIVGFRLVKTSNDIDLVAIRNLRADQPVDGLFSASFDLVTTSDENDYPSLKVFFLNDRGGLVRTQVLSPREYPHGQSFKSETVAVSLRFQAGEAKFSIAPFYAE